MARPSPVPPKRRVVAPSAWAKGRNSLACCWVQPDARVLDLESKLHPIAVGRARRDRDVDLALLGELDRVAGQVGQDLPDAQRIAQQQHRHLGRPRDHQFQILLRGAHADQGGHVVEHVVQTEDQAFQLQFGSLDLGQVQDVVDDAEQMFEAALSLAR